MATGTTQAATEIVVRPAGFSGDDVASYEPTARRLAGMPMPRSYPRRRPSLLRRFARDLLRGAVLILLLHSFVLQVSVVRGVSMQPSLRDGDRLVVDRLAYTLGSVARFDVVVLRYPKDPAIEFVKRIVGLPGDLVAIDDGVVHVNGEPLTESFAHVCDHASHPERLLGAGEYFVLGDNRPISCDSREFGIVPGDHLKGKVRVRFWPPARIAVF